MPDVVRDVIEVLKARPIEASAALMAAILYLRLMTSGPRLD